MEPANPLLPALRPDTPALLRRTGSLLGAVQGIQQEASAEYWLGLLQSEALIVGQRKTIEIRCSDLLRCDIEVTLKVLEENSCKTNADGGWKYEAWDADSDGCGGSYFDDEYFYDEERAVFDELFCNYGKLAGLQGNSIAQGQIMLDGAERIGKLAPDKACAEYFAEAYIFDRQEATLQKLTSTHGGSNEAERLFAKIINEIPAESEPYLRRACHRQSSRKCSEALDDLNIYLSIVKTNASAFKQRGWLRYQLGDVAGMVEDATSAQQLGAVLEDYWPGDPPLGPDEAPF